MPEKLTVRDPSITPTSDAVIHVVNDPEGAPLSFKMTIADAIAPFIGGSAFIDQSGGTTDTYGVLAGAIDGGNTTYTVSNGVYTSGTLKVSLNGQLQTQGASEDWTETIAASGTFDFAVAPVAGDEITVEYNKVVTAGPAGIVGIQTAVSILTSGENLIGVTDTSSARTITISTADILAGSVTAPRLITIKDVSGAAGTNNITVDTEGAETIDGVANILISVNFGVARLYTNGSNLFTI